MVAGVIGHHGNHVIQLVAGDTDHVFEHALIRGPNGTDWIATEVVFLTEVVMCTVVQVWISLLLYFIFPSFGPKFKPSNLLLPGFVPSFPRVQLLDSQQVCLLTVGISKNSQLFKNTLHFQFVYIDPKKPYWGSGQLILLLYVHIKGKNLPALYSCFVFRLWKEWTLL